jgi:MFS family permease
MISLSTPSAELGTAFGVHRALDTTGAVIGPLVAFAILSAAPLAFHSIFLLSFCIALVGFGILVLFVRPDRRAPDSAAPARPASLRGAVRLLRVPRYRAIVIAGAALSLATASDAFVFLALQEKLDLGTSLFPLLFVGSSLVYMVMATPMGGIADRVGRGRVFLAGYGMLLTVYAVLLLPSTGWIAAVVALALLGMYYAATDGVLMALGSTTVPGELRGSGLALLGTATSLARLVASLVFGLLWTVSGLNTAFMCFAVALVLAVVVAAIAFRRSPEPANS